MMPFYEEIAAEYDAMTGFGARLERALAFVQATRARGAVGSAVDVACGTGVYALALARCGVRTVIGTDISPTMLELARRHAAEQGLAPAWVEAPMQELRARLEGSFDLLLCLGNSVPHLLTAAELDACLAGAFGLLNPGGRLVLQVLNYDRILARQERIVEINRRGEREYVRFYDLAARGPIRFNLLAIRWPAAGGECAHELHSTLLYPYRHGELTAALARHGFGGFEAFGGLRYQPYDPDQSDVLLLVAHRPG